MHEITNLDIFLRLAVIHGIHVVHGILGAVKNAEAVDFRRSEKGVVTIPYDIRKELGISEGDTVVFIATSGEYVIKPANVVPRVPRR